MASSIIRLNNTFHKTMALRKIKDDILRMQAEKCVEEERD
jgi:hypothetical protein